MTLPTRYWADMTWRDFARADMAAAIAVLPVAAIEQHGPHLRSASTPRSPPATSARAAAALPADLPVLFLPFQAVGVSDEHAGFPGTLTLPIETAIAVWTAIGDAVARTGCRSSW